MSKKDLAVFIVFVLLFSACNNSKEKPPEKEIVATPEELDQKVSEHILQSLDMAEANKGMIDDSIQLDYTDAVKLIYKNNKYKPVWSGRQRWNDIGDTLFHTIGNAKLYGLFPEDYHFPALTFIRTKFGKDTLAANDRRDAVAWSKAELMMTDAFVHMIKDIKLGRLKQDSIRLVKDTVIENDFYSQRLKLIQKNHSIALILHSLEPKHEGYRELKEAIPSFLASANDKTFTHVPSPKDKNENFINALQKRLYESGHLAYDSVMADSVTLAEAIKKFQKDQKITVDGKAGEETVRTMNISDHERFIHIAITMDRYKIMPPQMPSRYILVNLPGYYMYFYQNDTLQLTSKIVCGKPANRTPLLNSSISELVTYPQWTVPESIIEKEILPGIKKDSDYLAKKGFSLIDRHGDEVDPYTVEWSKYKKGIPYKVVQGSGDENALGILKFNFPNKYAVYLHDTNQRYLFGREKRSLSHGCVRVQNWEKLAYSIVRFDNKEKEKLDKPSPVEDSLTSWLKRKEKHHIGVRNKLPVYIRYFTCDVKEGKIIFYDDIYGEDEILREKYFAGK